MNILVSACLLGVSCRYDGTGALEEILNKYRDRHNFIPVCPEIFGGLQTPRNPAEISGDRVITSNGEDVTENYKKGSEEVLKLAQFYGCTIAVLKERSPSCGKGKIYDGSFKHMLIDGNGITAELLTKNGIEVIGESKLKEYFEKA